MAGKITISTLNNDTGVLATQNGMTGIAKAWVQFVGSSATINGSFNVSSVTRNGTGDYTINFTTVMPNSNYGVIASASNNNTYSALVATTNSSSSGGNVTSAPTTSSTRMTVAQPNVGYLDAPYVCVSVFSS